MKKYLGPLLGLCLVASFPAGAAAQQGAEWEPFFWGADGSVAYLRPSDKEKGVQSRTARVWVKFDESKNKRVSWRTSISLYTIDCATDRLRLDETTAYYRDNSHDTVKLGTTADVSNIIPDTMGEELFNLVCKIQIDESLTTEKP